MHDMFNILKVMYVNQDFLGDQYNCIDGIFLNK